MAQMLCLGVCCKIRSWLRNTYWGCGPIWLEIEGRREGRLALDPCAARSQSRAAELVELPMYTPAPRSSRYRYQLT